MTVGNPNLLGLRVYVYLLYGIVYSAFPCVMCGLLLNVCEFRDMDTHHDSFLYATDSRIKWTVRWRESVAKAESCSCFLARPLVAT